MAIKVLKSLFSLKSGNIQYYNNNNSINSSNDMSMAIKRWSNNKTLINTENWWINGKVVPTSLRYIIVVIVTTTIIIINCSIPWNQTQRETNTQNGNNKSKYDTQEDKGKCSITKFLCSTIVTTSNSTITLLKREGGILVSTNLLNN